MQYNVHANLTPQDAISGAVKLNAAMDALGIDKKKLAMNVGRGVVAGAQNQTAQDFVLANAESKSTAAGKKNPFSL